MKTAIIYIALIIGISLSSSAQINTLVTDSLKTVLESSPKQDSTYINTLLKLTGNVRFYDLDEALIYAGQAEKLAKDLNVRTELAASYYYISAIYHLKGFSNLSEEYAKLSAATFEAIPDLFRASFAYNLLGIIYTEKRQDDNAIQYLSKSLEVSESLKDTLGIIQVLNNIGNLYVTLNESRLAKEYFQRAVKHIEANGLVENYGECYVNLASQETDKALSEKYLKKAESAFIGMNFMEGLGQIILLRANDAFDEKRYQKSISLYKEAVLHFKKHDLRNEEANAQISLAGRYLEIGQYKNAESLINDCLAFAQELNSTEVIAKAYELKTEVYEKLGRPVLALESYKALKTLNDSIDNNEKRNILAENEAKYQSQEKARELEIKEQELLLQKARNSNIIIWALIALLGSLGLIAMFYQRQQKRKTQYNNAIRIKELEAKNLKEKEEIKSAFFANISHEFRTPLTLIISPLKELISDRYTGNIQELYKNILKNGERLLDLINQLLELSKLETGNLKLEAKEGDIGAYIKGLAATFQSMAEVRDIHFEIIAPKEAIQASFDQNQVHKIISNLLSNAFKFTPDLGKVSLKIIPRTDTVNIAVTDSGIGIDKEALAHVFDRFYQSNTTSSNQLMGSGIGLALTKELVELHRGTIGVESEINKGSIFTVSLPILNNTKTYKLITTTISSSESINTPHEYPEKHNKQLKGKLPLLLIVEDNEDVSQLLKESLAMDYEILLAQNGKMGVEMAKEFIPEAIISDVMMPEMDGHTFTELTKNNPITSHIPIIMLTALSEQKDKMQGLETGADAYLSKPFEIGELKIRLAKLIELRENLKQSYSKSINLRPEEIKVSSIDQNFMVSVNSVLEKNLNNEAFGVNELAEEMALSRKQLNRKLKAILNQSGNEIIRNYRLDKAHQMLLAKAINPTEASYQFGFGSPAYFSKCFSDRFGYPPSKAIK